MFISIERECTPELILRLCKLYGKDVKIIAKMNHQIVYIDTPKGRVIFSDNWNMTPAQLAEFMAKVESADSRKPYPFHSPSAFAMSFCRRNYGLTERHFMVSDGFKHELSREAGYGGRNEAYKIGGQTLGKFDINSSYPYHATKATLPIPGSLQYQTCGTIRNIAVKQGMSRVTFTQSEDIPLLPIRENNRVYYANGTFTGTYTHSELRYALENGLITDVTIHKQYVSEEFDNPLHDFMKDCYDMRKEDKVWKMIANSLIGRLFARADGVIDFRLGMNGDTRPENSGLIMKLTPKHAPHALFLFGTEKIAMVKSNPLWAAEIYSLARITLYDAMITANNLWYCDTDCIIADSNRNLEIGTELGQWKFNEAPIRVYGAKQYTHGEEIVWKGVSFDSPKREEIHASVYTQERMLLEDGTTRPYSQNEAKNAAIAAHIRNRYISHMGSAHNRDE